MAHRLIVGALPPVIASVLEPQEIEDIRQRLDALPAPPSGARLSTSDLRGALGVFLLVFLTTFPVAVPFIVMRHASSAMRASNAIAVVMMFVAGVAYARIVGRPPWALGLAMVVLGCVLVALTIALGG
jgi:VIT1/CCC1 family predicted Fe2+/Mn2+ transporter